MLSYDLENLSWRRVVGFVIQMQRRAIEELFEFTQPFAKGIAKGSSFSLSGSPLYFLGVSEGFGTCSGVHGVYVLVFATEALEEKQEITIVVHGNYVRVPPTEAPLEKRVERQHIPECTYAVLLREATKEEYYVRSLDNVVLSCVELLEVERREEELVIFSKREHKALYVNM